MGGRGSTAARRTTTVHRVAVWKLFTTVPIPPPRCFRKGHNGSERESVRERASEWEHARWLAHCAMNPGGPSSIPTRGQWWQIFFNLL